MMRSLEIFALIHLALIGLSHVDPIRSKLVIERRRQRRGRR